MNGYRRAAIVPPQYITAHASIPLLRGEVSRLFFVRKSLRHEINRLERESKEGVGIGAGFNRELSANVPPTFASPPYIMTDIYNLKLLLIGDSSVGKSSLLLRFADEIWLPEDESSAT